MAVAVHILMSTGTEEQSVGSRLGYALLPFLLIEREYGLIDIVSTMKLGG